MQIMTQLMNWEGFTSCTFHKEHRIYAHFFGCQQHSCTLYNKGYTQMFVYFTLNNVAKFEYQNRNISNAYF